VPKLNLGFVLCHYCNKRAELVTGNKIYPNRRDLWDKSFWRCLPCKAYVGCHGQSSQPLGRLADKELRKYKSLTHQAFDPVWQRGYMPRREAYSWLADKLGIAEQECHIAEFDVSECKLVIAFSNRYLKQKELG